MTMAFAPRAPGFMRAPHEAYRALRAQGPIFHEAETGIFYVLDHALVAEVMRAPDRFSSTVDRAAMRAGGMPQRVLEIRAEGWPLALTLSHNDGPSHDAYRALVAPFFTPRALKAMRPFVEAKTNALVDSLPAGRPVDLIAALAVPLPIAVIGELLGMGRLGDTALKRWSDAFADEIGFLTSEHRAVEIAKETLACHRAMMTLVEERRGGAGPDVITALANAEIDGRPLEPGEILSILTQLLVAGNETTTATLAFALLRLAEDPALLARLSADRSMLPAFIEEVLRLDSPIQGQFRKAIADERLGGVAVPAGSLLHVRFASANRDERVFGPDDDQVQLGRRPPAPHLAFGLGLHFCVGAGLSRLELDIVLNRMLDRFSALALAVPRSELPFRTHFHHRNLLRLPMECVV
ncbi:MAG: cytochrome P450 [Thermaurantiacus sp.]